MIDKHTFGKAQCQINLGLILEESSDKRDTSRVSNFMMDYFKDVNSIKYLMYNRKIPYSRISFLMDLVWKYHRDKAAINLKNKVPIVVYTHSLASIRAFKNQRLQEVKKFRSSSND